MLETSHPQYVHHPLVRTFSQSAWCILQIRITLCKIHWSWANVLNTNTYNYNKNVEKVLNFNILFQKQQNMGKEIHTYMQRMEKAYWQGSWALATGTSGQSWTNIFLQSRQISADSWTNSEWHLCLVQEGEKGHLQDAILKSTSEKHSCKKSKDQQSKSTVHHATGDSAGTRRWGGSRPRALCYVPEGPCATSISQTT